MANNSNAIILDNCASRLSWKGVNHKIGEILYQKIRSSPRPPPKVTLKSVWHVEQERTGKPVADQATTRPGVDLRYQSIPPGEPQQDEEISRKQYLGKFVHAMMSHPNREALIAELQRNTPHTHFSEESQHVIHTLEHIDSFELCQISRKSQGLHREIILDGRNYTL